MDEALAVLEGWPGPQLPSLARGVVSRSVQTWVAEEGVSLKCRAAGETSADAGQCGHHLEEPLLPPGQAIWVGLHPKQKACRASETPYNASLTLQVGIPKAQRGSVEAIMWLLP